MKKGFTLVELLGVIIILGILSVLIVPKVINVLNESEEKNNLSSATGLLKAADYKYNSDELNAKNEIIIIDYSTNQNVDVLEFSGKKPEAGNIVISKDGQVAMRVKIGDKCYIKKTYIPDIEVKQYDEDCKIKAKNVGDVVTINDDEFNVIWSNESETALLRKEILYWGNKFSDTYYWIDPATNQVKDKYKNGEYIYVYDENSSYYEPIEKYKESLGGIAKEARLMKLEESIDLGCNLETHSCQEIYPWLVETKLGLGTLVNETSSNTYLWQLYSNEYNGTRQISMISGNGILSWGALVRPVIIVNTADI